MSPPKLSPTRRIQESPAPKGRSWICTQRLVNSAVCCTENLAAQSVHDKRDSVLSCRQAGHTFMRPLSVAFLLVSPRIPWRSTGENCANAGNAQMQRSPSETNVIAGVVGDGSGGADLVPLLCPHRHFSRCGFAILD
eukprot:3374824-Prymnesium_polylepis.1